MITSSISDELKLHESNGSLSVIASIADVNHLYGCQGLAILSNGTTVFGELQPYVISPISMSSLPTPFLLSLKFDIFIVLSCCFSASFSRT